MKLYIVRHAEAFPIGTGEIATDEERFLTPKGRKDAARIGEALRRLGCDISLILTSPLVRARETAEQLAAGLKPSPPIETEAALAPPGTPARLLDRLDQAFGDVAIVGHEPFLGEFFQLVLNGVDAPPIALSKSSVACLKLHPEETKLKWLLNPNLIKVLLT